ncbi:MAG TPA: Asp-tRNA(Asn)/Glu-tRNA(Gln) amidotransferase subunit GatB [Acidimicrobiales bacterium]|nr:Asp-tRNA(Asn)/Glu-tRNA(Gln) amidotransferase subunit GatB [Acidimicrobiales bacterium]
MSRPTGSDRAARPRVTSDPVTGDWETGHWEMVVGLEIHCELKTATKLFCGCPNTFGAEPNTNVCPVCLGLPGSLPVLNRQAVELAMRIGAALHCDIRPSIFHRKNYFYPDQAKDYQISQYDEPINVRGWLELPDGTRIGVTRAHLEEDTGKTTHVGEGGRIHAAEHSLVDYNRSGIPLVEIVSEPDMRSPAQARAYATELRAILVATGASDGRMEEGSMRIDANVSVRPRGSTGLGVRCEVKNLNSLRSLGRALEYEAARQIALLESGEPVVQETRHWDEETGRTSTMRSKEEAYDYRYFPEPDLVPVVPDQEWIDRVRESLPPLPSERRKALVSLLGGEVGDAQLDQVRAVVDLQLDGLVTAAVERGAAAPLALARAANEVATDAERGARLDPASFAALLVMEEGGRLSATQSKNVLLDLLAAGGGDPEQIAKEKGFEAMSADAVGEAVAEVVAAHPAEWEKFAAGDDKVAQFLVGQVMRRTKGKADGKVVSAELRRLRG